MDYKATTKKLIDIFYKERTSSHLNEFFFLSTHLHFALTLEIAFANYSDEEISLEKLYEKIPRIFGSRSTIKYTLSDGVKKNFFVKNISRKDKRVKVYHLDYKSKLTLETWLEKRKNLVYTN